MPPARRLLLHIGHPKTGTTSLQETLQWSHECLLGQSILHPQTDGSEPGNNKDLAPHFLGPPAAGSSNPGRDTTRDQNDPTRTARAWDRFVSELHDRRPDTVVISSEYLFRAIRPAQRAHFSATLRSIATDLEIIAYLRSPASFYLSALNQRLKFYRPVRVRQGCWLRPVLEPMMQLPPARVSLNLYDRSLMTGGDTVQDFFARYLPDFDTARLTRVERERNTTISTEAMALLQASHCGELDLSQNKHRAARAICEADRGIPYPTLPDYYPEARQAAINRASADLLWLRDVHDLTFPDIDYGRIRPAPGHDPMSGPPRIEDICPIDPQRKAELLALARRNIRGVQ
ncbi:MAG: hypothetical protein HND55_10155 [Pseudomonadota bacterium]|nr:MAG: hypothetical protein HND55_10155 [Pseudomonadota bacterium]